MPLPADKKSDIIIEKGSGTPIFERSGLSFLWEVTKTVILAVIIIVLVHSYLFKPFYVKGASMEPNFHDDEYLIINELNYRFRMPDRGEVIVLRFPRDPKQFFIKRVIGLPNEKVSVRDGSVFITNDRHPDGMMLDEKAYLSDTIITSGDTEVRLGPDQFFVLGDNRPASLDSRSEILGPISRSAIIGSVWFRLWPLKKITAFHPPVYTSP